MFLVEELQDLGRIYVRMDGLLQESVWDETGFSQVARDTGALGLVYIRRKAAGDGGGVGEVIAQGSG